MTGTSNSILDADDPVVPNFCPTGVTTTEVDNRTLSHSGQVQRVTPHAAVE